MHNIQFHINDMKAIYDPAVTKRIKLSLVLASCLVLIDVLVKRIQVPNEYTDKPS